jgi:2-dehydropantoate 2-reductase
MRFIVYGAGAVGGVVGGRLFEHGHDVVLIARGAQYEAIRADGLGIDTFGSGLVRLAIPVVDRPEAVEFEDGDVVMLAMKSPDTEPALQRLRAATSLPLPIVCLQNGVANEPAALRYFERVYAVVITLPAVHLEPGIVEAYSSPITGVLDLGRFPDGVDSTAQEIAAVLADCSFVADAVELIMPWKYRKLIVNLVNGLLALCGPQEGTAEIIAAVQREAEAVLAGAGIACTTWEEFGTRQRHIDFSTMPTITGSTWQSLYRGGNVETEYLNGEIVLIARLHGLSAPLNNALTRVVRDAVRAGVKPGTVSLEQAREWLAAAGGHW